MEHRREKRGDSWDQSRAVSVCVGGESEINVFIWKKENVLVFANCQTYLLNGFMTDVFTSLKAITRVTFFCCH